ncbi:chaperonin GroEL [Candidatus Dojkabacteria bacterium]|nr:chaperonin GroEL [Candidatus Dojkabacteria bacterium]
MAKLVTHGDSARENLLKGANLLADAVKSTLGPGGRNVAIGKSFGGPQITKDGVTVAKSVENKDPLVNAGVDMIKEAAVKTGDIAGDGTTTAVVIAQSIIQLGIKNIAAGANPMEIRTGVEKGIKVIVDKLEKNAKKINTRDEVEQVAVVSTNNDKALGALIADVIDKVGKDGVVTVEESKTMETTIDYVEGMQFDKGYISPYFVTNTDKLEAELEDPAILITDKKLSTIQDITPIAERILQGLKKPLVIIADEVENQALATLVYNKLRGAIQVVAVKAPGFGDRRKSMLEDIAILTGANVISEETGRSLESIDPEDLGSCEKIIVQKENTIIVGGSGEKKAITERVAQIKKEMELVTSDYDKEKLQERLAKLSGGVAVINVGGATEVELKERKDRVDDALHATRGALESGVLPGGGIAFLDVVSELDDIKELRGDEVVGIKILKEALMSPIKQIAENAGKNGDVVVDKCGKGIGYDARNDRFIDMVKEGIVDAAKVTKYALIHGASVAVMLLTTEALIVDEPEDEKASAGAPDMGGMGMM